MKVDPQQPEPWHDWPVRVYYEDTDAQGIVYFANYSRFMERGRTEWLRVQGISQSDLAREHELCFSLINSNVRFVKPALFDDELVVRTRVSALSGARVTFQQAIHRGAAEGELLCAGDCVAACLHTRTLRPQRIPQALFGGQE